MKHISNWQLEQYVLAELPVSEMRDIQNRVKTDTQLKQRIKEIHESNAALLKELPAQAFAKSVLNDAAISPAFGQPSEANEASWLDKIFKGARRLFSRAVFSNPRHLTVLSGAALCALFVVTLVPMQREYSSNLQVSVLEDTVRIKGLQPFFNIYRLTDPASGNDTAAEKLTIDSALHENDTLQLSYVSAGHLFGYIVSIDGNDVITVHLADGENAARLDSDGEIRLTAGYRLDDAPEFERFIFISSPEKFKTELIDQALNELIENGLTKLGRIPLAEPLQQSLSINSVTFRKAHKD